MLDAALVLDAGSAASVIRTSLGAFWAIPHVNVFAVRGDVLKGGIRAGWTKTFRLTCEVFPE